MDWKNPYILTFLQPILSIGKSVTYNYGKKSEWNIYIYIFYKKYPKLT